MSDDRDVGRELEREPQPGGEGRRYGDAAPGEPDPANATAEELLARSEQGEAAADPAVAEAQAAQILRESDERTEDRATVDPYDESIERRTSDEQTEPGPDPTAGGSTTG